MATRSNIGMMLPDGNVKVAYCHYDGYPECVGKNASKGKTRMNTQ